jgi:hypothetical protein
LSATLIDKNSYQPDYISEYTLLEEKERNILGTATLVWYIIGFIFIVYTLLFAYTQSQQQFNSALIFALAFLGGLFFLTVIGKRYAEHIEGDDELGPFWMENPIHKSWLIGLGFVGVVLVSWVFAVFNQPFWAIFSSGIIMLFVLFETRSILGVILIHGAFNSLVLAIQGGLLGNSLVPLASTGVGLIPIIGINIPSVAPIFTEFGFQLLMVSPAEEILKIVVIALIIIFFKQYYQENTVFKWVGGIGAVALWSVFHYIVSLQPH